MRVNIILKMSSLTSRMVLNQLELAVRLGWPDEERAIKQTVWLDIYLDFNTPLAACFSDQLEDTFCYDTLTQFIEKNLAEKSFHLIEYLGCEIYQLIKNAIPNVLVTLCITKKPAIVKLKGGVSFWYGDKNM